jgi:hypothetical protein
MRFHPFVRLALAALFALGSGAHAAVAWTEADAGDLSSDGLAPTALSFASGANTVAGSIGAGDADYFSFVVPAGMVLSAINMNPGTYVSGAQSFIAIQAGPQVTYPVGGTPALLAFNHYDAAQLGSNILVGYLLPSSSPGLTLGTYSVWLNETGGEAQYSFDFVLTLAVPEPAAGLLFAAGMAALTVQRRRAKSSTTPQKTVNPTQ